VLDNLVVPVSPDPVPVLSSPFDGGEWYGGDGPSNSSVHRRSVISLEGGVFIAQRFATDWGLIGKNGDTKHDDKSKNENYWCFGQPVHAVADGAVTEAVDQYPDNQPGTPLQPQTVENTPGNHVILRIGQGQYVLFAHLKSGSVRVHVGDKVKRGGVIALVGNSGNSTGSHLHMHVMDRNSPLASEGIPYVFDHFNFLGWGKDFEESKHPDVPHKNEMPVDDMVVGFQ
jgi:Peptidase family M23